ncbi:MAG: sulfatase [Actinomycetia bacterium]|nr:sulfatase [Actinomycetes bacterium]
MDTGESTSSGAPRRPPNVVLINCDDLGYGDLGCYGSELNRTPTLDRLADEGVRLTDFYAASPLCSPSRAALLTGCYPPRVGMGDFDGAPVLFPGHPMGLNPDEVTIAGLLRDAGYATSLVGKWHCGDQPEFLPTEHGFDEYFGIPYSNDMGRQRWFDDLPPYGEFLASLGLQLPLDEMPPLPLLDDDEVLEAQPDQAGLTERYLAECVRFMRRNADQPFFLYLAHMYVHLPIYVQERFARQSGNGRYGAAVESIDWATEVILRELDTLGLAEDTIVVFTSDNGSRAQGEGGSNEPLRGHKATTFEGGQRVPCIVRYPGVVPAGTTTAAVASQMDLYPTLVHWCGAELPADRVIDGRDAAAMLELGERSPHECFLFYNQDALEAVRSGRWKLFVSRAGRPVDELYDLEADIAEADNVFDSNPGVVADLMVHVQAARSSIGDSATGSAGTQRRPVGRVEAASTLTEFDPLHPYAVAEYDLVDRG